jgi:hypothetical protein
MRIAAFYRGLRDNDVELEVALPITLEYVRVMLASLLPNHTKEAE